MNTLPKKLNFFIASVLFFSQIPPAFSLDTPNTDTQKNKIATFAGGCFWCTQKDFDHVKGVVTTTVGYTGGTKEHPTYEEVSAGGTGHVEALQIVYDPEKVSYEQLLDVYFHNIDPTDNEGQFCDRGKQYRPVIFYHGTHQEQLAEAYKESLIRSKKIKSVHIEILPASPFYPAEEYHQKYYKKNPIRYRFYRYNCGRDSKLKKLWES